MSLNLLFSMIEKLHTYFSSPQKRQDTVPEPIHPVASHTPISLWSSISIRCVSQSSTTITEVWRQLCRPGTVTEGKIVTGVYNDTLYIVLNATGKPCFHADLLIWGVPASHLVKCSIRPTGGFYHVDGTTRKIVIYGRSKAYGPIDTYTREKIEEILQKEINNVHSS